MLLRFLIAGYVISMAILGAAEQNILSADHNALIAETHANSLKLRDASLRKTIAKDTCWPDGVWGDNFWTLAALYLDQKTDTANARLLKRANDYIERKRSNAPSPKFLPESDNDTPWSYFSLTDYVRTLYLFGSKSPHFPGRLKPDTEAAMKEALWIWVSNDSKVADAGPDDLFLLLGTENHDLSRRPNHYLITALLKDDPAYQNRKLADGHTVTEHAKAYTSFFREWPRRRAASGLWVEVGSNTYQKYSWPALFNLHELAPDPVIRYRFGLLLDLACIEEAQLSVQGRRGGGRSRGEYGANAFESYKNLLHATAGKPAGSSHSRVIETSRYQLPAAAILLANKTFPITQPIIIRNRVLGELSADQPEKGDGQRMAADSALINYAYRTSHYLLGSTLQNPALNMPDPAGGAPLLKYAGISRQKRACGILFDDPTTTKPSGIHIVIEHPGGGRPQHSFWSVQQENVLIVQRIARIGKSTLGSYNTEKIGIRFEGDNLTKTESNGWIFTTNGKAFVGIKFLDGPHQWDAKKLEANPARFTGPEDSSRILLEAGDISTHQTFEKFQTSMLANRLSVTPDKVNYQFGSQKLTMNHYDPKAFDKFTLPLINGKPLDLRPTKVYDSPYLNAPFGSDRISIKVGPFERTIDFSHEK